MELVRKKYPKELFKKFKVRCPVDGGEGMGGIQNLKIAPGTWV